MLAAGQRVAPQQAGLRRASSYRSSAGFSVTGEKVIFTSMLKTVMFIGLVSASSRIMLTLLPCLQRKYFREVQQIQRLEKQ